MHFLNSLVQHLSTQLMARNWQLVTAESCTGGLIAAALTDIPGSSQWFERGFVTYSNLAKEEMLGVSRQLLETHGAVSESVASAMAEGALQNSAGQVAVSVTGIAGPDGGSEAKPVGLVCIGLAAQGRKTESFSFHFSGTRQTIREESCQKALEVVLSILSSKLE